MNKRAWAFVLVASLAASILAGGVLAASPAAFDLGWHVVAGGGGVSTSAGYALHGTAGQQAAGVLSGEDYLLGSGFWGGGEVVRSMLRIHLPVVLRQAP